MSEKKMRIAKLIARSGYCSRRDAERLILEGRVEVDGNVVDTPAIILNGTESVKIDGKPIGKPEVTRLFIYHKPTGLITSNKDEKGRQTIFDKLPNDLPRLITVGRLDFNTEGLLLLTNDGDLARHLELPSTGWVRRYRVRAHGRCNPALFEKIRNGVTVNGIKYGKVELELDKSSNHNHWLTVSLREGKNREIRKLMEYAGLKVNRLLRVSYGPFQLGKLPKGAIKEVSQKVLNEQISGIRL